MSKKVKREIIPINNDLPEGLELPAGYEEKTSDLIGFIDDEQGFHKFIPLYAKVNDNKANTSKPSTLIVCRYVEGAVADSEGHAVTASEGDLVGLWYKPGMKGLVDQAGVQVVLWFTGEKDIGQPSPMKCYRVMGPRGGGAPLKVTEDYRKNSKGHALPLPQA